MNSRERCLAALRREQPDRVPVWELIVNQPVIDGLYPEGITYHDFVERELDGVTVVENQRTEDLGDGHYPRRVGHCPGRRTPSALATPSATPSKAGTPSMASPRPTQRPTIASRPFSISLTDSAARRPSSFSAMTPSKFCHYLRGMDQLFMDFVLYPDKVHQLSRIIIDYKKRVMQRALEMGADIGLTGDDYCHRQAPMMSPAHFAEFIQPYLAEIVEVTHAAGAPFVKHTDGNIWPIFEMMADTGIDAIDPLEPIASMDIGEVKKAWGRSPRGLREC